jgi:hypothetical protein
MYNILFKSSKETLECFGKDKRYLGAETGCIGILHTWGQKLDLHPHIHYITLAGGIDKTGKWSHTRSGGKYLYPVKAMSSVFRGKFITLLKQFLQTKGIELSDELRHDMYKKEWVVYAKQPFGGAAQVIEYLGRYTHKVAISNHRIQSIDNDTVVINGILSTRNKSKIRKLQTMMGAVEPEREAIVYIHSDAKVRRCPCCGKGEMHIIMSFGANAPPSQHVLNELRNYKLKQ